MAAVTRASVSISDATSSLEKTFAAPQAAKAIPVSVATRPVRARAKAAAPGLSRPAVTATAIPASPAALVLGVTPTDSVARTLSTTLQPAGEALSPAAHPASAAGTVRGYIRDDQGRPLAGATVLVKGTQRGTSTDATGQYVLEVAAGSTLQFGYGGYTDQLHSATLGSMNVVLQSSATAQQRAAH